MSSHSPGSSSHSSDTRKLLIPQTALFSKPPLPLQKGEETMYGHESCRECIKQVEIKRQKVLRSTFSNQESYYANPFSLRELKYVLLRISVHGLTLVLVLLYFLQTTSLRFVAKKFIRAFRLIKVLLPSQTTDNFNLIDENVG